MAEESSALPPQGPRHVRNTSEPTYSSSIHTSSIARTRSTSPRTRPLLSQLERQWSCSQVLSDSKTDSPFLHPEESPFQDSWTVGTSFSAVSDANMSSFGLGSAAIHMSLSGLSPTSSYDGTGTHPSSPTNDSIIHDAARITNWTTVLSLCQTHPQYAKYAGPDGWTALHHCCNRRCPHPNVVEALIHAYPDALLLEEEKGMTPLHYACRFKAPAEVVRLLLQLYPPRGHAAVSKRDRRGRTPLFYAVRYDAPPGVVEMLLEIDPSAVLEEDRSADSPLALVWDSWAEKFEGKRTLQPFLTPAPGKENKLRELLESQSKLLKKWNTVNLFLKAAFGFPRDQQEDHKEDAAERGGALKKPSRTWRVLHACSAIKCHPTLFLLALAVYPEQVVELDEHDLYPEVARQTALHLAAASPANGEVGRKVLTKLLAMFPGAAEIPDSKDGSMPLHYLVENDRKTHWTHDGAKDVYESYPLAAQHYDQQGRLPLHRAAAAHHPGACTTGTEEQHDNSASIVCNLVRVYPAAASHADNAGRLPLHVIAQQGEVWDDEAEAIYGAHEAAVRTRAGPKLHGRLPIHLAAASPDARRSLIERLVELHPLGVSQADRLGKLPLHLACESGKMWDKGVSAIYEAFPNAIRQPEGNARRWMALSMAAASPTASATLISRLSELYPEAAGEVDYRGRYALHLACASGKSWEGGLEAIFEAYPEAALAEDHEGLLPLHVLALQFASPNVPQQQEAHGSSDMEVSQMVEKLPVVRRGGRAASISEQVPRDEDAPKVEVLFQMLRAEPSVLV